MEFEEWMECQQKTFPSWACWTNKEKELMKFAWYASQKHTLKNIINKIDKFAEVKNEHTGRN